MVAVLGKNKKKTLKKPGPAKTESKFISQALINRRKSKGKKKKRPKTKGLVYVKNLPHGFFEEQLRSYFSQFGAVTRIRLGRSPTTLNSRGYAFIEFRYPEVAEIAAQAMNNYIMFHRIVKTKFIPPEQIRHDYFRSSIMTINKNGERVMTSKKILAREANVVNTNRLMTDEDQTKRVNKVRSKVSKQKSKLAQLGIDFDIDSVAKNMGEEVIAAPKSTSEALTIDNIAEDDLDGDNDETFDPSKFDIDSGDEFEDFNYDSDDSGSDEVIDETTKKTAIEVAKTASKKYKGAKDNKNGSEEKPKVENKAVKNKKVAQKVEVAEKPAKKVAKKVEEKPQIEPAKRQSKRVAEKVPSIEQKATKLKQANQKELKPPVEKKLMEKKNLKKALNKVETSTQKKVAKVPKEKVKPALTNEKPKESPKLKKVLKAGKKVGKKAAVK